MTETVISGTIYKIVKLFLVMIVDLIKTNIIVKVFFKTSFNKKVIVKFHLANFIQIAYLLNTTNSDLSDFECPTELTFFGRSRSRTSAKFSMFSRSRTF